MADASLDSFFAKKDKSKKSKTKTKFATSNIITKSSEEGGKKPEVFVKRDTLEKISILSTNHVPCAQVHSEREDDEWKFVEDESERDYSGLKVQALSICEKEKDDEQSKEQLIDENGEIYKMAEGLSGPWKMQANPPSKEIEEEKPPEVEIQEEAPVSKVTTAYKPPALRSTSGASPSNTTRRNLKYAPQITSELHFPSLSSAAKGTSSETDKYFQSVRHGARSTNDTPHTLKLDLENKFSALQ